ncbi:uncharacterized protein BDR25DRAFT_356486 [Lindgomyces ingoldianus]|uniref:Uncharacterized protein n=1 Tax=Lindgomyces ingoldianus TaxID=673940 RepID=A0ACB6QST8_9PLEO|nr:uncharacterized protein BDR25DRAFT_356486 [Lindgomyces ingoldianus]KAF2469236.1 hypothetical protein BDR25DRAFT_356486 [Lindgomyces ingoldianus]
MNKLYARARPLCNLISIGRAIVHSRICCAGFVNGSPYDLDISRNYIDVDLICRPGYPCQPLLCDIDGSSTIDFMAPASALNPLPPKNPRVMLCSSYIFFSHYIRLSWGTSKDLKPLPQSEIRFYYNNPFILCCYSWATQTLKPGHDDVFLPNSLRGIRIQISLGCLRDGHHHHSHLLITEKGRTIGPFARCVNIAFQRFEDGGRAARSVDFGAVLEMVDLVIGQKRLRSQVYGLNKPVNNQQHPLMFL